MLTIVLTGRVAQKGELRKVGETVVLNFTIATDNRYKTKSGSKRKDTTFVRCAVWGPLAEQVVNPYVEVGQTITVRADRFSGTKVRNKKGDYGDYEAYTVYPNAYLNKDGEARANFEITVTDIELGPRNGGNSGSANNKPQAKAQKEDDVDFATF